MIQVGVHRDGMVPFCLRMRLLVRLRVSVLCIRHGRSSGAGADAGFRLCQETEEKAKYFGQQFIELWAEYLKFNFSVGNRLK